MRRYPGVRQQPEWLPNQPLPAETRRTFYPDVRIQDGSDDLDTKMTALGTFFEASPDYSERVPAAAAPVAGYPSATSTAMATSSGRSFDNTFAVDIDSVSKLLASPAPAFTNLAGPPLPAPDTKDWEAVGTLVRKLPVYMSAATDTGNALQHIESLQSVSSVLIEPLLSGHTFYLVTPEDEQEDVMPCQLRLDRSTRILHWSVDHESGLFRGSLLLRNLVHIDLPPAEQVAAGEVQFHAFALHVWQGYGTAGTGENPAPSKLTFLCRDQAVMEVWVSGLKFLRDVQPVAAMPKPKPGVGLTI